MKDYVELADGRRFGLATYGASTGHPVLALHGAPASRIMFDVTDTAAKKLGLRILCPERPGYGITKMDDAPSLASRASDLEHIANCLGLGRFSILGVSGGGPYAVALAERIGDRVLGMALVSPLGPLVEFRENRLDGNVDKELGRLSLRQKLFFLELPKHPHMLEIQASMSAHAFRAAPQSFASLFSRFLTEADTRVLAQDDVRESLIAMTLEAIRPGVAGGVADLTIYSKPWNIDYQRVDQPTIIWQGTSDGIVPPPATLWLASRLPNCRLETLKGAGHFWVYDHVDEILEALAGLSRRS